MNLYPFDQCAKEAERLIAQAPETTFVYQQFNCANCGRKQTMDDANVFHLFGKCEECGHITNIKRDGCNYAVVMGVRAREGK